MAYRVPQCPLVVTTRLPQDAHITQLLGSCCSHVVPMLYYYVPHNAALLPYYWTFVTILFCYYVAVVVPT